MEKTLFVRWIVKDSEASRILATLPELTARTRSEKGNLHYAVYRSDRDPREILIHERYVDTASIEAHRKTEHYERIVLKGINPYLELREVTVAEDLVSETPSPTILQQASQGEVMSRNVLIIVSNANVIGPRNRRTGNFLSEVAHPYMEFDRARYHCDFASLTGDTPYLDALHLAGDPDNLAFLTGKGWADMQKARKLSDVDVGKYDAIFMPGGLAPMVDMPEHPLLKSTVKQTYERGAVVGAVCHGPASLLNVRLSDGSQLLAGKNVSSFTNDEEENYARHDVPFMLESALVSQGAKFHKAGPWQPFSIADGNLVTGQNPASAKGVAEKMIELMAAGRRSDAQQGVAAARGAK